MMEGQSFNRMVFCSEEGENVWCKGELLDECDLDVGPGWKHLIAGRTQTVILKISVNGCISVSMPALQVGDSGTYWFGILYNLNIVPIKKFRLIVLEGECLQVNIFYTQSEVLGLAQYFMDPHTW